MDSNPAPAQPQTEPSSVVWFEIIGQDQARLRAFFGELFHWRFDTTRNNYSVLPQPAQGIPGGLGTSPEGCAGWTTFYVKVKDLDASLARAVELGAKELVPATRVTDCTRIAVFADPEGHPIGLVQESEAA